MFNSSLEHKTFLLLLVAVSVAFGWVLLPFSGAVFWAAVLAILFAPLQRRLYRRFHSRSNLSALLTLTVCVLLAVVPMMIVTGLVVQEGASLYKRIESGELDIGAFLGQMKDMLPLTIRQMLDRLGLNDLGSLRDKMSSGALQGSQFLATKAFNFGQDTFQFVVGFFVMLYLLFFFIRDGGELSGQIKRAIPLSEAQKRRLFSKFTRVVRATVKGNIVVAAAQGALGGLIFMVLGIPSALLWGVLMAFLSLLPAIGAGLVWAPVAVYFLLSGALWKGMVLALFGICVIGLVDNILRPILVGKDTRMPDYLVLISTLGGLSLFGLNGFVIGPLIAALFVSCWGLFTDGKSDRIITS